MALPTRLGGRGVLRKKSRLAQTGRGFPGGNLPGGRHFIYIAKNFSTIFSTTLVALFLP